MIPIKLIAGFGQCTTEELESKEFGNILFLVSAIVVAILAGLIIKKVVVNDDSSVVWKVVMSIFTILGGVVAWAIIASMIWTNFTAFCT